MTPRYERLMFRLGVLGMLVVLGIFGYRTIVDPIKPAAAELTTTTTSPDSVTSTTVEGETTTTVEGETTTTTTVDETTTTTAPAAPFLVVSPRDETRVAGASILLAGTGTPGGVVSRAELATNVDERGVWSLRIPLAPGANELELTETLPDGAQRTTAITVHYDL